MKKYIIEAHRGVSSDYPENALAAFRAAVRLGYGMIELDTKFTADGHCVILHDRTVNRTARNTDGAKLETPVPIAGLTLAEARQYDYGAWFGSEFRGEQLPTLEDALGFALENRIPLKFDNVMFTHTDAQTGVLFDTIERMGTLDIVGFTAATVECVEKVLERFPSAAIHFDGELTPEVLARLSGLIDRERLTVWMRFANARTAWCKVAPISPESAALVRRTARIGVWLLDTPAELETAVNVYSADIIETNGTLKPFGC